MTTTEQLCSFSVNTGFDDIPQETVQIAKDLILDFLGAAIGGSVTPVGRIVTKYVEARGGTPEAGVIGGGFQTSASDAAFVNATLGHALEFEAVSFIGGPNPAVAIPAGLALAEKLNVSGKKLLESFILGFEVQGRIAAASPGGPQRGWDVGSLYGTLGTAVTGAKVLGLNLDQTMSALGIAASLAGGLIRNVENMVHTHEFGIAARGGVEAAELAQRDFVADKNILEGPGGYCDVFFGEKGYDLVKMTKDLGNLYQIAVSGVSIKKYPCCYRIHRALDAVLELIQSHNIPYPDVDTVEIDINRYDYRVVGQHPDPKTGTEARFSMEHCIAVAILDKRLGLESVSEEKVGDPKYKEARSKVKVTFHPEWPPGRMEARTPVTITLKDGKTFSKEVDRTRNSTRAELLQRTKECAGVLLSSGEIDQLIEWTSNLEKVEDMSQLMGLLRKV